MMQRAYRLTRRSGAAIFLFEERALAARPSAPAKPWPGRSHAAPVPRSKTWASSWAAAGSWARRFVRVPDWSTAPLAPGEQAALLRRVRVTGLFAAAAVAIVILIVVISNLCDPRVALTNAPNPPVTTASERERRAPLATYQCAE